MQHVSWNRESQGQMRTEIADIPNSYIIQLIDEWVHSERDRKILKRRLIDGICFEPLAEEFDMSVRQIKNIVYKNSMKVFSHVDTTK